MNRLMELSHLAEADRHLREGRQRVEEQEARLARLKVIGADTDSAEELLKLLCSTLEEMHRHRSMIAEAIDAQNLPLRAVQSRPFRNAPFGMSPL